MGEIDAIWICDEDGRQPGSTSLVTSSVELSESEKVYQTTDMRRERVTIE